MPPVQVGARLKFVVVVKDEPGGASLIFAEVVTDVDSGALLPKAEADFGFVVDRGIAAGGIGLGDVRHVHGRGGRSGGCQLGHAGGGHPYLREVSDRGHGVVGGRIQRHGRPAIQVGDAGDGRDPRQCQQEPSGRRHGVGFVKNRQLAAAAVLKCHVIGRGVVDGQDAPITQSFGVGFRQGGAGAAGINF